MESWTLKGKAGLDMVGQLKRTKIKTKKPGGPATATNGKGRLKQQLIPGTEPEVHKDINDAADDYRDVRDQRMQLMKPEALKKATLLAAMQKHKLRRYSYGRVLVEIVPGDETVRVRTKKEKKIKVKGSKNGAAK